MSEPVIHLKGLPFKATEDEIAEFLDLGGVKSVTMVKRSDGKPTGEAFVICLSEADKDRALNKNRASMKGYQRFVEVYPSTIQSMETGAIKSQSFGRGPKEAWDGMVRMRGLPYEATLKEVEEFFTGIHYLQGGVVLPLDAKGLSIGQAYVQFETYTAANEALLRHKQSMRGRYIELFKSSNDELRKALIEVELMNNRGTGVLINSYNGTEPWGGEGTVVYGGLCMEADKDGIPVGWMEPSIFMKLHPGGYRPLPGQPGYVPQAGNQPNANSQPHQHANGSSNNSYDNRSGSAGGPMRAGANGNGNSHASVNSSAPYQTSRPERPKARESNPFPHVVAMHNVAKLTSSQMIQNFFKPLKCHAINNHGTGLCEVAFKTHQDCVAAMMNDGKTCNGSYIRLALNSVAPIKTENSWYN